MIPGNYITKKRSIWQVNALQLMRESAWAQYAGRTVPSEVDGVKIGFPQIEVALGWNVVVRSQRLSGQSLFSMLYEEGMQETALRMGLIALKALHQAEVTSAPFGFFGSMYQRTRGTRVRLVELFGSSVLSTKERRTLTRLVDAYLTEHNGRKVLVHGDLQASHIFVDLTRNSLGFIDLEAMRIGKATTNFAQLWQAFYFADPLLGRRFFQGYLALFPGLEDERFDADVRGELTLRNHRQIRVARQIGNPAMERHAFTLLHQILDGASFEEICLGGDLEDN
jgi:aminoglycoside phosphotransferase